MKSKKTLKVLSSAALVATVAAPVAAPVFAANYTVPSVQVVSPGETTANLGRILVEFNTADANTQDTLTLRLPSDFKFNTNGATGISDTAGVYNVGSNSNVTLEVPAVKNGFATPSAVTLDAVKIADNELKIKFNFASQAAAFGNEKTAYFYINLNSIEVPGGYSGEVKATLTANSGSRMFSDKEVVLATVGSGKLNASIDSVKTITTSVTTIDNIRIKEDRPGAFSTDQTFKVKLPNGFKWTGTPTANVIEGNIDTQGAGNFSTSTPTGAAVFSIVDDGRTLQFRSPKKSTAASTIILSNLNVAVEDETVAKKGDVVATISGTASSSVSELTVAKYGDYAAKAYVVGDPKTVLAGRVGEKIAPFAIEEDIAGSLIADRTITLQLVGKAKWTWGSANFTDSSIGTNLDGDNQDIKLDSSLSKNTTSGPLNGRGNAAVSSTAPRKGEWALVGANRDTLKLTIDSASSGTAALKAVFKDARINVAPDAEGDIKVIVGGTAGVTGELTVAKVQKPVSLSVNGETPNVVIGSQAQELGEIVLAENQSEAIDKGSAGANEVVQLEFPDGVLPSLPTSVTVTEGDLALQPSSIERVRNANGRWAIQVRTKATSSKPSKISFKGIKVTVDRTVPEGELKVKVIGDALLQTTNNWVFPGNDNLAEAVVAKVVTPAAGKGGVGTAVFKLNSKSFTVDGKTVEMDVQPLVKWDRAYVPVRFAANALGVADENILWDDKTQTVTIFHNGKVVQMTVGKKEYSVNGVKVAMDVPVFRNKVETNNRTLLPIRYVAQALGVPVNWNQETGEIVLGEQK